MSTLMEKFPNTAILKSIESSSEMSIASHRLHFWAVFLLGWPNKILDHTCFLTSTIQHQDLSYCILCYSCMMLLVSSHISSWVIGSRSIWNKDTGSTEAGFCHLLSGVSSTTITPQQLSIPLSSWLDWGLGPLAALNHLKNSTLWT